jgi:sugar/nucleoside kinase (ribokinase family)
MNAHPVIAVAGHTCLDIIPTIRAGGATRLDRFLVPGKLIDVGAAVLATGGAVPNAGLALHRLGVPVRLMGKVGADHFGTVVRDLLEQAGPGLAAGLVTGREPTSYTVVISPPGTDRIFLHCPGANDSFGPEDVDAAALRGLRLFHFGYPPLMRRMYEQGGAELEALLRRVKEAGVATSLDMARPDPDSPAGRVDWPTLLARVLPQVDVFLPSFDEILYMLDRRRYEQIEARHGARIVAGADPALLEALAGRLFELGAAVVGLKLGDRGLYLATTPSPQRLAALERAGAGPDWFGRRLLAPCYRVSVAGTTGSGDCTIAGFLMAVQAGMTPEQAVNAAVAVGACSVEQAAATSGVPLWADVVARQAAGWPRFNDEAPGAGWVRLASGAWRGPDDGAGV